MCNGFVRERGADTTLQYCWMNQIWILDENSQLSLSRFYVDPPLLALPFLQKTPRLGGGGQNTYLTREKRQSLGSFIHTPPAYPSKPGADGRLTTRRIELVCMYNIYNTTAAHKTPNNYPPSVIITCTQKVKTFDYNSRGHTTPLPSNISPFLFCLFVFFFSSPFFLSFFHLSSSRLLICYTRKKKNSPACFELFIVSVGRIIPPGISGCVLYTVLLLRKHILHTHGVRAI